MRDISAGTEAFSFCWGDNGFMKDELSATANLVGDPGRAAILLSLLGGIALPAGELAHIANVAPQTASGHLAKLIGGGLLTVERQGRHRYYRLLNTDVADAIESLLVLAPTSGSSPRSKTKSASDMKATAGSLAYARTCYAHLAGWLAVQIADRLEARGFLLTAGPKLYSLTTSGRVWFESLGIKLPQLERISEKTTRRCLDWTERRHHLAGTLGCSMLNRFQELGWVTGIRGTRTIRVTLAGKRQLWDLLRIPIS
jgi:DNA-binding transcriptional ArsR family regulator